MESTKTVTDKKIKVVNAKEAWCLLEVQASRERLGMCSPFKGSNCGKAELATMSAALQVAKAALNAMFDHIKRHAETCRRSRQRCRK